MKKSEFRVASYVRNMNLTTDKFTEFDRMIKDSKGKINAVLITAPEVLGDNYDEIIDNLNELAAAELQLIIVPPSQRVTTSRPMN